MDLHQIELFLAMMETGSVRQTGERVQLTPGAVSLQLHNLATDLRTELFRRDGRRLVPTPAALRLQERARELIVMARAIEQEFIADPAHDTRPFHFSTGPTTLIHRLGKPLKLLRARFPQSPIRVTVAPTEVTIRSLLEGNCDLGLISLPVNNTALRIFPLFEEEMLFLRPGKTLRLGGQVKTVPAEQLKGEPFLLYPTGSNMRAMIDGFLDSIGLRPDVVMEADDTEAIKRLVESGFGHSILPAFALKDPEIHIEVFRAAGHRLIRQQALAMAETRYPRSLTISIVEFLRNELAGAT